VSGRAGAAVIGPRAERRPAIALAPGPGAARALAGATADGAVELVLAHGAYLRFGADWILACEPQLPFGPLSLTITGLDWSRVRPGDGVRRVGAGRLRIGGQEIDLERVRSRRAATAPPPAAGAPTALSAALAAAPPPPSALAPGLTALERGDPAEGLTRLAGLGDGLTPAGDDVLAGFAAWRHADGRPATLSTAATAARCSRLGLAYLRCAERGELPDPAARARDAIRRGQPAAAARAARALASWGASSGHALLWGLGTGARASAGSGRRPRRAAAVRPQTSSSVSPSAARKRSFSSRVP
jgi:hypothetical protein